MATLNQCCALEAGPLKNLEEILNWTPNENEFGRSSVNLQSRTRSCGSKSLICHDMMSGYLDDRFVQGVEKCDSYRFFHWALVDTFVYFSHNFITIPVPGWIDAGHLHGVKVLGTLITEWDDGERLCDEFLYDMKITKELVNKLVALANFYNFDGWLINIENKIQRDKIDNLQSFLKMLTNEMHEKIPGSEVIWYDSVINTGELAFQNELNQANKCFFDCCDAIYLNYNWKDEHLERSLKLAMPRVLDVYAGIDVFGRGTLGGGGFNCSEPLKLVKDRGLSVALFAPGWVYEVLDRDSFSDNEYKFWSLMAHLLPIHGPSRLPFSTSFCQGFGEKVYMDGKVLSDQPWCNLSLQQHQPTFTSYKENNLRIYLKDAFDGGGCVELNFSNTGERFPLLHCSFQLNEKLIFSCVWKCESNKDDIVFVITLKSTTGIRTEQTLKTSSMPNEMNLTNYEELSNNWICSNYLIDAQKGREIESVQVQFNGSTETKILIGKLELIPPTYLHSTNNKLETNLLEVEKNDQGQISCLLKWSQNNITSLPRYFIFCQLTTPEGEKKTIYVGTTRKHFYKVWQLCLPSSPLGPCRFVIQTRGPGIDPAPLDQCPFMDVT